jgi:hypothetical protein
VNLSHRSLVHEVCRLLLDRDFPDENSFPGYLAGELIFIDA